MRPCRLQVLGNIGVLGHPTRYGQVVPYRLPDRWKDGTRKSSACGIEREKDKIRIERDDTHGQSQKNLGVARQASIGDAFVTGDQVVLDVAYFSLCMLWTYLTFCWCEKW